MLDSALQAAHQVSTSAATALRERDDRADGSARGDSACAGPERADTGVLVEDVSVTLGGAEVLRRASVSAARGRTLVILGPSGCGKTTLLRVLSGLQRIDSGRVLLGAEMAAGPGVHLPAESRNVGMVFQDWALFPHLSVAANVAFGLPRVERRSGRLGRNGVSPRVDGLLEMLGLERLADRSPGSLSGGQQQRVALARALAPRPSVLLLDEPFSSLDTSLRVEVRAEVAALLRALDVTCVFVTHDQDEAFVLGDEVAVMRDGVVVQQAPPAQLYDMPADRWVADFVGEADTIKAHADGETAASPLGPLKLRNPAHGDVEVLLRPEEIVLAAVGPSPNGTVTAVIEHIEFFGHDTLYYLRARDGTTLRSRATGAPRFPLGADVELHHSQTPTVAFQ